MRKSSRNTRDVKPLLTTEQFVAVAVAMFLSLPIVGMFLYRRGNRTTGGVLVGIFAIIVLINLINLIERK